MEKIEWIKTIYGAVPFYHSYDEKLFKGQSELKALCYALQPLAQAISNFEEYDPFYAENI